MAESMLRAEIPVYSEIFDIHGVIRDYGVVTKLFFSYEDKDIVMGITWNVLSGESLEDVGRKIIETYVTNLANNEKDRKLQLHYWYVKDHEIDGETLRIAHGIVTGHKRLSDSTDIHTSPVQAVHVDEEAGELVVTTKNSVYHCPLEYCRYRKQDEYPDIIPEYERLKEKYKGKIAYPSIEPGKVLLVLANFDEYYFHSLYYVPKEAKSIEPLNYTGWPHVGMFQDSYLINTEDDKIDLRYFPHYQNIEFYFACTDGCPLYIENIGDIVLYAKTAVGTIKLKPGERKKVTKENTEPDEPFLPGGDLYPAGIIE